MKDRRESRYKKKTKLENGSEGWSEIEKKRGDRDGREEKQSQGEESHETQKHKACQKKDHHLHNCHDH